MRLILFLSILAASPLLAAPAGGSFSLEIFQGYHFSSTQVVKSGTDTADLNFTYQTRRTGFISYLGADKIKYFETAPAPGSISSSEIARWQDYVAGPGPGYYVLRAKSNGRLYLVQLLKFENQGRAASYWRMHFEWREFDAGSGKGAAGR
jgi:hypothetical protein